MLESPDPDELLNRAADGDERALTELFTLYRKQLKRMVRPRLNEVPVATGFRSTIPRKTSPIASSLKLRAFCEILKDRREKPRNK